MKFNKNYKYAISAFASLLSAVFCVAAHAETSLNLAKSTQNPIGVNPEARHFTLPFVNYTNFGNGTTKSTQDMLEIKPVIPFRLNNQFDFFLKTIVPFTHQASGTGNGYLNGLGDINPTLFIGPAENRHLLWGLGPTMILPTATNTALGAGKLSVGPELVLIAMPDVWTLAILTYNVWSVAGHPDRPSVNEFNFQYFITYNFVNTGWYLTTQPTITANWMTQTGNKWTLPFGAGVGRLFSIGHQPINFSVQAYDNVVRPSTGPHWTMQCTLEFLFSDNRI